MRKSLFFYILPAALILGITISYFNHIGNFFEQFNLGQGHHDSRLRASNLLTPQIRWLFSWQIFALVLLILLVVLKKLDSPERHRKAALLMLLATTTYLSARISNAGFTQGAIVAILCMHDLWWSSTTRLSKWPSLLVVAMVVLWVQAVPNSIKYVGRAVSDLPLNQSAVSSFFRRLTRVEDYTRIEQGSFKGMWMHKDEHEALQKLRVLIEERDLNFFALGYYSFLYVDYKIEPPKQFPLWLHYGKTVFKGDESALKDAVLLRQPKLIILHSIEDGRSAMRDQLAEAYNQNGYVQVFSIFSKTASGQITANDRRIDILSK